MQEVATAIRIKNASVKKVLLIFANSAIRKGLADADELKRLLEQSAKQDGRSIEVYVTYARSLSFFVSNQRSAIYDHKNRMPLEEYDFVYFRKAGSVMQQMLSCAIYLQEHGVPFFDKEIFSTTSRNKLSQMFKLRSMGISIPTTLYCRHKVRLLRLLRTKYSKDITFPVIAKATGGTRGAENFLVNTPDELLAIMSTRRRHFLIQDFVPNDGDYRVLVANGQVKGIIHRKSSGKSHLNNTSQGAVADWLPLDTLSDTARADAAYAAVVLQRDFAGVDVIIDKITGEHHILEVNRAPQLENASFPEQKAAILVEAFEESIATYVPSTNVISSNKKTKRIIGRFEKVTLEAGDIERVVIAKIDTGADTSSIHCEEIREDKDASGKPILRYVLWNGGTEQISDDFGVIVVRSSSGHEERRYTLPIHAKIGSREFNLRVTLSRRQQMKHEMLLGRRFLRDNNLVVDVARRYIFTRQTDIKKEK